MYIIGWVLSASLSFHTWHSYAWLIVHSFLSWFYVIYWLTRYGDW